MKIPRIERGDPLTAAFFNSIGESVNELQTASAAAATAEESTHAVIVAGVGTNITPGNVSQATGAEEGVESVEETTETEADSVIYRESSRSTITVRIEDPNDEEVYVDVEKITSMVLIGNEGDSLSLVFNG